MVCGLVGYGRLLAEGRTDRLPALRAAASDGRWRVREGVVLGLQRLGDADVGALLAEMKRWSSGNPLERRAAIAAVCEPRLLRDPARARQALDLLDEVTASLVAEPARRSPDVRVLRKSLGYCWSVAVAADPEDGWPRLDRWLAVDDPDVARVIRENLRKARLRRVGRPGAGFAAPA